MFEQVKEILVKQLRIKNPDQVTPQSNIKEDLGADSLDILQLLMTIEEDYGIQIPDEALAEFTVVQDIVDYLDRNEQK